MMSSCILATFAAVTLWFLINDRPYCRVSAIISTAT